MAKVKSSFSNFDQITESPKALAAFLDGLNVVDAPWEKAFQALFCADCKLENCPEICPYEKNIADKDKKLEHSRPLLWLHMPAEV